MAALNKMLIRGIRSFDDKQSNIIEFYSPVTVICGHNGSGKTTIIECLKYATTGDMPPNTKGGAFIHDPKMAQEKEVKAQVKLRFRSVNKQMFTAVRNVQVTVRKGGLTMKTLEGVLSVQDASTEQRKGKVSTISTKCSELDTEIPRLLGVSKAVLDNVIFCHQEESNWPLSEPAALKKKFDEIFEASRYTKALKQIQDIRKERAGDLKVDRERLSSLKTDRDRAEKIKQQLAVLEEGVAEMDREFEELDQQISALSAANKIFYQNATKFNEIYNKVETLEEREKLIKESMSSIKETMQELPDSDAELASKRANFQKHLQEQRQRRAEEVRNRDAEDDTLREITKRHQNKLTERGQLEAEARKFERDINERQEIISEIAARHGIRGFDYIPLEDAKIEEFIDKLRDYVKRSGAEVDRIRREGRDTQAEYANKLQMLNSDLAATKQAKAGLRQQIGDNQARVLRFTNDLERVKVSQSDITEAETELNRTRQRFDASQAELTEAAYDDRIAQLRVEVRKLEDEKDKLGADMAALNLQADTRARLGIKKSDRKAKLDAAQALISSKNAKHRQHVGTDAVAESMESTVTRTYSEKQQELGVAQTTSQQANRELQQIESTVQNYKAQHQEKRKELQALQSEVNIALEENAAETLGQAIQFAQEEVNLRRESINGGEALEKWFEETLDNAKVKHACRGCGRHIKNDEMSKIERHMRDMLKRYGPQTRQEHADELKDWEAELDRLKALQPAEETIRKLKDEIPKLDADVRREEAKLDQAVRKMDQVTATIEGHKADLAEMEDLRRAAIDVSRLTREARDLGRDIALLERELEASSNSTLTVEDVQEHLNTLTDSIKRANTEVATALSDKEKKTRQLNAQQQSIHKQELDLGQLRSQYRERENVDRSIEEVRKTIAELHEKSKAADDDIAKAAAPICQLEEEKSQHAIEVTEKEGAAQRAYSTISQSLSQMDALDGTVKAYINGNGERRLRNCVTEIDDIARTSKETQKRIDAINSRITELDREAARANESERNLGDNIRYREKARELADIRAKINEIDLEETAKAKRQFDEKYDASRRKETQMRGRHNVLEGQRQSERNRIKERRDELNTEYKNIHRDYIDQLIKVKTSDLAIQDLEKYGKALENAIMRYHGLKMEEINEQIQHLWQKTYQGTDIDNIQIRSDAEGAKGGRTYNYRVVMTKDNVEMDMRGRCSAGQKVLASIIIRLALADSFGSNCGILALDEPTTNLDKENIDALAVSLADIINERRTQSSFQLLIITHDEDFLGRLAQHDVLDYY